MNSRSYQSSSMDTTPNKSEQFIQKLLQLLQTRSEKLVNHSVELSSALKDECAVLDILTSDTATIMTEPFKPFFKYYQTILSTDNPHKHFPLNKNNLPSKFQDTLDDILHDKINVMFAKLSEKPSEFREALNTLTHDEWVIMTFSRANVPLLHKMLDIYRYRPTHMKVILNVVPLPVWFCPWHVDEFNMIPIQTLTKNICHFNMISMRAEQQTIHTLINNKFNSKIRFLKVKNMIHNRVRDHDILLMFSNVAWYLTLDLGIINLDYEVFEQVNLHVIK